MKCRKTLLIFATFCTWTLTEAVRTSMVETIPAYTIALNSDILNSSTCRTELEEFRHSVDNRILWSLHMLDTSGRPLPGFINGNSYWLGSRSQCNDLSDKINIPMSKARLMNNSRYRNPDEEFPPFPLHFFVVHMLHNSTIQYHAEIYNENIVKLGLCMPESCTTEDLRIILESILRNRTLLFGDLYQADLQIIQVKDLRNNHEWLLYPRSIISLFLLTASALLVTIGTMYDWLVYQRRLKQKQKLLTYENNNTTEEKLETEPPNNGKLELETPLEKMLMCFSAYTNTKRICKTTENPNSIPAIHGLRFFGMAWVIFVHTLYYAVDTADNPGSELRLSGKFYAQPIANGTYSVDTFFLLSGFFLAQCFYKFERKRKDKPNFQRRICEFFSVVLKRYIRLTPAYALVICISQVNYEYYDKVSVFHMNEKHHELCAKYWWRNILYINNLFSRNEMCLSWSWYLSNDMQYFIIGMILLILSTKYFYLASSILLFMLFGSIVLTGYLSYSHEYIPTLDMQFRNQDLLYDPPWTRIGPYMIGMILGYVMLNVKSKVHMNKVLLTCCWFLGIMCNLVVLNATYDTEMSIFTAAVYAALGRSLWAIGMAWMVFACCTNNGGVINAVLSSDSLILLSKLTYCAYLLNPLLIASVQLQAESAIRWNILHIGADVFGMIMISYLSAYVLTLLAEMPYILMLQKFLNARNSDT